MSVTRGYGLLEGFLARKRAEIADSKIPPKARSGRILDIGCGTEPYFLIKTKFKIKYGIDPAVTHRSKSGSLVLKRQDVQTARLPFQENYFDVVTVLAVVEHMEPRKLKALLKEILRVLRPGGRLVLTTPCTWTHYILVAMAKLRLVSSYEISEHKAAYNHRQLRGLLSELGFRKVRCGYFELFLNNWAHGDK